MYEIFEEIMSHLLLVVIVVIVPLALLAVGGFVLNFFFGKKKKTKNPDKDKKTAESIGSINEMKDIRLFRR